MKPKAYTPLSAFLPFHIPAATAENIPCHKPSGFKWPTTLSSAYKITFGTQQVFKNFRYQDHPIRKSQK